MRFLMVLLAMSLSLPLFAQETKPDYKQMNKIIKQAYEQQMNQYFLDVVNSTKKHKLASSFLIDLMQVPKSHPDHEYIITAFAKHPAPKVVTINKGIEVRFENEKLKLQLAPVFGAILQDGKQLEWTPHNSLREMIEAEQSKKTASWSRLLIPQADAAFPVALLLGKIAWAGIKYGVGGAVVGAAGGAAVGAGVGCVLIVHTGEENQNFGERCAEGALGGAMLGGSATGAVGGIFAPVHGGIKAYTDAEFGTDKERAAVKTLDKRFLTSVKFLGGMGAVITLFHTGKAVYEMNGVEVQCHSEGRYSLSSLHMGAKSPLYTASAQHGISVRGSGTLFSNEAEAKEFLIRKQNLDPDVAGVLAKNIWQEHLQKMETCKKNPDKVFKSATSDLKIIDDTTGKPAQGAK